MNYHRKIILIRSISIVVLVVGLAALVSNKQLGHTIIVKTLGKKVLAQTPPVQGPRRMTVLAVPILMYHHVGDVPVNADPVRRDLTVSTQDFTTEVSWLAEHHYHAVTLEQVYEASQGSVTLPSQPVVFTFDDGYDDVFYNAVPLLQHYGYVGSFGMITHFVGTAQGTNTYATWDAIRQAAGEGMEIVSHTQDHFDGSNPKFNYDSIKQNLTGSRTDLLKNAGVSTNILIYPYGHFTPDYIQAAQDSGFVMGLTVNYGTKIDPLNLFTTPRVRVHSQEPLDKFIQNLGN